MNCEQIRELIPDWLDGGVEASQARTIEKHLTGCRSCREEAEFWRAVGTSLRQDAVEIKAPTGFAAGVVARLPGEKPAYGPGGLFTRWKRGLAAAAAFMLLAGGSVAGYMQWVVQPATRVAENPPGQVIDVTPEPGSGPEDTDPATPMIPEDREPGTNPGGIAPGNDAAEQPGDNEGANTGSTTADPGRENDGQPGTPAENTGENSDGTADGTTDPGDYALLSIDTNRFVERTLVKINVAELDAAREQALQYMEDAAAEYEILVSESTTGGDLETIKMTVDNALAEQLIANLQTLGEVITAESQRDDITTRYNEKVEQYRSLKTRFETVDDPVEREQLQVKMASIKTQLKTWDRESRNKTRTIILWLER